MALLKQSFIQSINRALDNEYFSLTDFDVKFPVSGDKLAFISFAHNTKYYFIIHEGSKLKGIAAITAATKDSVVPITTECPGNYKTIEEHYHESFDSCVYRISNWCKNIREDLRTNSPVFKEIDDLKQQFEEHIKAHIENPEDPISISEAAAISARFDTLYAKFEELKERHEITEAQLRDVKKDFEIIKGNASEYPKGLWANLTASRLVSLLKKIATSPEGRKLMFEGAKKLLLGNGPSD
ncbi:MAG: hypothetical protein WAW10_12825 [Gallionella sp.]